MKYNKIILIVVGLLCIFAISCKKDISGYENDPRINFFERISDDPYYASVVAAKSFSFAVLPAVVTADTILIKVKIMGSTAATDRKFTAEAIKGTIAAPGTDYRILEGTIKANDITGYLPVVVFRTPDLKTVTKTLMLRIADAGDFKAGAAEENTFTLNWNDNLIKPDNWDTFPGLKTYFGAYSAVKYQFIIGVLGRYDFPLQTSTYDPKLLTHAQMLDLKARVNDALTIYNNTHATPLTDEFGVAVALPLT